MECSFKGIPKTIFMRVSPLQNGENEVEPFDVDFSKTSLNEKEKENNIGQFENSLHIQLSKNEKRKSSKLKIIYNSLLNTISSIRISTWIKIKFVFLKIFSIHILVMLLTFTI